MERTGSPEPLAAETPVRPSSSVNPVSPGPLHGGNILEVIGQEQDRLVDDHHAGAHDTTAGRCANSVDPSGKAAYV